MLLEKAALRRFILPAVLRELLLTGCAPHFFGGTAENLETRRTYGRRPIRNDESRPDTADAAAGEAPRPAVAAAKAFGFANPVQAKVGGCCPPPPTNTLNVLFCLGCAGQCVISLWFLNNNSQANSDIPAMCTYPTSATDRVSVMRQTHQQVRSQPYQRRSP